MSYASWLSPSKTQGAGNDTVNVTASADNTGRNARSTNMTFKAANCEDVVRQVTQAGKPEFVTIAGTAAIEKTGGIVGGADALGMIGGGGERTRDTGLHHFIYVQPEQSQEIVWLDPFGIDYTITTSTNLKWKIE